MLASPSRRRARHPRFPFRPYPARSRGKTWSQMSSTLRADFAGDRSAPAISRVNVRARLSVRQPTRAHRPQQTCERARSHHAVTSVSSHLLRKIKNVHGFFSSSSFLQQISLVRIAERAAGNRERGERETSASAIELGKKKRVFGNDDSARVIERGDSIDGFNQRKDEARWRDGERQKGEREREREGEGKGGGRWTRDAGLRRAARGSEGVKARRELPIRAYRSTGDPHEQMHGDPHENAFAAMFS